MSALWARLQATGVWDRLVWSEFRQARTILLAAVVVPPVLFTAVRDVNYSFRSLLISLSAMLIPFLIALWAGRMGASRKPGADFGASHMPLRPQVLWMSTFAVPVLATTILGGWLGMWASSLDHWRSFPNVVLPGMLILPAMFAISYLLSSVWTAYASAAFGVLGSLVAVSGISIAPPDMMIHPTPPDSLRLLVRFVVASGLAMFIFTCWERRFSLRARRRIAVFILIASIPIASKSDLKGLGIIPRKNLPRSYFSQVDDPCKSFIVRTRTRGPDDVEVSYIDQAKDHQALKLFPRDTALIDVREKRFIYMLQQDPGKTGGRILVWDTRRNRVSRAASLPILPDTVLETVRYGHYSEQAYGSLGSVRPDGHYLVALLKSPMGRGRDLWLVDLARGTAAPVIVNERLAFGQKQWFGDKVFLAGHDPSFEIDLRTAAVRRLQ